MGPDHSHRNVVIFIQSGCQMRCPFCVTEDNFDPADLKSGIEFVDQLQAKGTKSVIFGGGEPFYGGTHVMELAEKAKSLGFLTQVGTNAINLPENFEFDNSVDRWVIPLESIRPDIHNFLRPWKTSHHEIVMNTIEKLGKVNKSVTISTVLTSVNVEHVSEIGHFLGNYVNKYVNVHAWHLYRLVEKGRGGANCGKELQILPSTYYQTVTEMKELGLPFDVYRRFNMSRSKTVSFYQFKNGQFVVGMT